jgi:hypothetical protein
MKQSVNTKTSQDIAVERELVNGAKRTKKLARAEARAVVKEGKISIRKDKTVKSEKKAGMALDRSTRHVKIRGVKGLMARMAKGVKRQDEKLQERREEVAARFGIKWKTLAEKRAGRAAGTRTRTVDMKFVPAEGVPAVAPSKPRAVKVTKEEATIAPESTIVKDTEVKVEEVKVVAPTDAVKKVEETREEEEDASESEGDEDTRVEAWDAEAEYPSYDGSMSEEDEEEMRLEMEAKWAAEEERERQEAEAAKAAAQEAEAKKVKAVEPTPEVSKIEDKATSVEKTDSSKDEVVEEAEEEEYYVDRDTRPRTAMRFKNKRGRQFFLKGRRRWRRGSGGNSGGSGDDGDGSSGGSGGSGGGMPGSGGGPRGGSRFSEREGENRGANARNEGKTRGTERVRYNGGEKKGEERSEKDRVYDAMTEEQRAARGWRRGPRVHNNKETEKVVFYLLGEQKTKKELYNDWDFTANRREKDPRTREKPAGYRDCGVGGWKEERSEEEKARAMSEARARVERAKESKVAVYAEPRTEATYTYYQTNYAYYFHTPWRFCLVHYLWECPSRKNWSSRDRAARPWGNMFQEVWMRQRGVTTMWRSNQDMKINRRERDPIPRPRGYSIERREAVHARMWERLGPTDPVRKMWYETHRKRTMLLQEELRTVPGNMLKSQRNEEIPRTGYVMDGDLTAERKRDRRAQCTTGEVLARRNEWGSRDDSFETSEVGGAKTNWMEPAEAGIRRRVQMQGFFRNSRNVHLAKRMDDKREARARKRLKIWAPLVNRPWLGGYVETMNTVMSGDRRGELHRARIYTLEQGVRRRQTGERPDQKKREKYEGIPKNLRGEERMMWLWSGFFWGGYVVQLYEMGLYQSRGDSWEGNLRELAQRLIPGVRAGHRSEGLVEKRAKQIRWRISRYRNELDIHSRWYDNGNLPGKFAHYVGGVLYVRRARPHEPKRHFDGGRVGMYEATMERHSVVRRRTLRQQRELLLDIMGEPRVVENEMWEPEGFTGIAPKEIFKRLRPARSGHKVLTVPKKRG